GEAATALPDGSRGLRRPRETPRNHLTPGRPRRVGAGGGDPTSGGLVPQPAHRGGKVDPGVDLGSNGSGGVGWSARSPRRSGPHPAPRRPAPAAGRLRCWRGGVGAVSTAELGDQYAVLPQPGDTLRPCPPRRTPTTRPLRSATLPMPTSCTPTS